MKPQLTILVLVVAAFAIHLTFGIKCYQCKNCEQAKKEDLKECMGDQKARSSPDDFSCAISKTNDVTVRRCFFPREDDGCNTTSNGIKICFCNTDGCTEPKVPEVVTSPNTSSPLTSPTFLINFFAILTFFGFLFI